MYHNHNSSNSESENDNFDDEFFKKVNYQGNLSDSEDQDNQLDDSNSDSSKKPGQVRRMTGNKSTQQFDKSKAIKKNCESAKMSRQRKKVYLQLLEQKAQQLKTEIYNRKNNIKSMSGRILSKFQRFNKDKYKFLTKKIALSKKLLALSQQATKIKINNEIKIQQLSVVNQEPIIEEIKKKYSPETLAQGFLEAQNGLAVGISEVSKGKVKRKKGQDQRQQNMKNCLLKKISEKESELELGISAYMYQFGVRGALRSDVIQRSKFQWFETLKKAKIQPNEELFRSVNGMKDCLSRLDNKTKILDYHLRELKERVKQKYVVQFLLDRQFFIHNSIETIFKKTQVGIEEQPILD